MCKLSEAEMDESIKDWYTQSIGKEKDDIDLCEPLYSDLDYIKQHPIEVSDDAARKLKRTHYLGTGTDIIFQYGLA
jgi:hypothetical protein